MRSKILAVATAAVLMFSVAPAQAATVVVGGKCTTKWAVAKAGTVQVYCGKNTNASTKKKYALAWVKSKGCYVNLPEYQKSAADIATQVTTLDAQVSDVQTKFKALNPALTDTATLNTLKANIDQFVNLLNQVKSQAADNRSYMLTMCP